MTAIDTIRLPEGARVSRTYWAYAGLYGMIVEQPSRTDAEEYAREHPTRVVALSYEERDRGVRPAGSGRVELRAVVIDGQTEIDAALVAYDVFVERFDPDAEETP